MRKPITRRLCNFIEKHLSKEFTLQFVPYNTSGEREAMPDKEKSGREKGHA
jgi:hypothetical protein